MPSNSSSSSNKMFRTRAIDPQRQMPIRLIPHTKKSENSSELEMLYSNKSFKRSLFTVASGMEKEEEKVGGHLDKEALNVFVLGASFAASNWGTEGTDVGNFEFKPFHSNSRSGECRYRKL